MTICMKQLAMVALITRASLALPFSHHFTVVFHYYLPFLIEVMKCVKKREKEKREKSFQGQRKNQSQDLRKRQKWNFLKTTRKLWLKQCRVRRLSQNLALSTEEKKSIRDFLYHGYFLSDRHKRNKVSKLFDALTLRVYKKITNMNTRKHQHNLRDWCLLINPKEQKHETG